MPQHIVKPQAVIDEENKIHDAYDKPWAAATTTADALYGKATVDCDKQYASATAHCDSIYARTTGDKQLAAIQERDAAYVKIIQERDATYAKVIQDRDENYARIIKERDEAIVASWPKNVWSVEMERQYLDQDTRPLEEKAPQAEPEVKKPAGPDANALLKQLHLTPDSWENPVAAPVVRFKGPYQFPNNGNPVHSDATLAMSAVTPSEKKIVSQWAKDGSAIADKGLKEWSTADDKGLREWSAADDKGLREWSAADDKGVNDWAKINDRYEKKLISKTQADAAEAKVQQTEDAAKAKAQTLEDAAKAKAQQEEDAAKAKAQREEDAGLKKITTPQVLSILDKELTALIPGLEAAGMGSRIGNGDNHITLDELKKTITHYDIKLFEVDANKDGVITLPELNKHLQPLPVISKQK